MLNLIDATTNDVIKETTMNNIIFYMNLIIVDTEKQKYDQNVDDIIKEIRTKNDIKSDIESDITKKTNTNITKISNTVLSSEYTQKKNDTQKSEVPIIINKLSYLIYLIKTFLRTEYARLFQTTTKINTTNDFINITIKELFHK